MGDTQAANAAASSLHSNVAPASLLKAKLASLLVEGLAGVLASVVSGAVVSTVQVWLAGVGSAVPPLSMALTANVWEPSLRPV